MTLIQYYTYVELIQGKIISITITPKQAVTSALLKRIRRLALLRHSADEATEIMVHGNETTRKVEQFKLIHAWLRRTVLNLCSTTPHASRLFPIAHVQPQQVVHSQWFWILDTCDVKD